MEILSDSKKNTASPKRPKCKKCKVNLKEKDICFQKHQRKAKEKKVKKLLKWINPE